MKKFAGRATEVAPFYVMDILATAKAMAENGRDIIHLEVGEPDFDTPAPITEAGIAALKAGKTHYTPALGLPALREAIANWYDTRYHVTVAPERIIVTPGASGALLLLMGAVLERDHEIMLADPGYPCNRHFARFLEARSLSVPCTAEEGYQLTPKAIEQYWGGATAMALVASPANPTGSVLSRDALLALSQAVKRQSGYFAVDEIYHGLTYDGVQAETVLAVDQQAFVINSFSKFFGMTGWRLGWLVVPEGMTPMMDRLAQNLFLAPATPAQYAALAAFEPDTLMLLEERRQELEKRRNSLMPALTDLGLIVKHVPEGAFYLYANCEALLDEQCPTSLALAQYWLEKAGVAVTPGHDFGTFDADTHLRFAYTQSTSRLLEAVARIKALYQ